MHNKILLFIALLAVGVVGYLFYTMDGALVAEKEGQALNLAERGEEVYLVDKDGFAIYYNALRDEREDGQIVPTCDAVCEETWLPYLLAENEESPVEASRDPLMSKVNLFERADGTWQYAIGTKLLYRYSLDTAPGEPLGIDEEEGWILARP